MALWNNEKNWLFEWIFGSSKKKEDQLQLQQIDRGVMPMWNNAKNWLLEHMFGWPRKKEDRSELQQVDERRNDSGDGVHSIPSMERSVVTVTDELEEASKPRVFVADDDELPFDDCYSDLADMPEQKSSFKQIPFENDVHSFAMLITGILANSAEGYDAFKLEQTFNNDLHIDLDKAVMAFGFENVSHFLKSDLMRKYVKEKTIIGDTIIYAAKAINDTERNIQMTPKKDHNAEPSSVMPKQQCVLEPIKPRKKNRFIVGKRRILEILLKLHAFEKPVLFSDVQAEYKKCYGVFLNADEQRRIFRNKSALKNFTNVLSKEVKVTKTNPLTVMLTTTDIDFLNEPSEGKATTSDTTNVKIPQETQTGGASSESVNLDGGERATSTNFKISSTVTAMDATGNRDGNNYGRWGRRESGGGREGYGRGTASGFTASERSTNASGEAAGFQRRLPLFQNRGFDDTSRDTTNDGFGGNRLGFQRRLPLFQNRGFDDTSRDTTNDGFGGNRLGFQRRLPLFQNRGFDDTSRDTTNDGFGGNRLEPRASGFNVERGGQDHTVQSERTRNTTTGWRWARNNAENNDLQRVEMENDLQWRQVERGFTTERDDSMLEAANRSLALASNRIRAIPSGIANANSNGDELTAPNNSMSRGSSNSQVNHALNGSTLRIITPTSPPFRPEMLPLVTMMSQASRSEINNRVEPPPTTYSPDRFARLGSNSPSNAFTPNAQVRAEGPLQSSAHQNPQIPQNHQDRVPAQPHSFRTMSLHISCDIPINAAAYDGSGNTANAETQTDTDWLENLIDELGISRTGGDDSRPGWVRADGPDRDLVNLGRVIEMIVERHSPHPVILSELPRCIEAVYGESIDPVNDRRYRATWLQIIADYTNGHIEAFEASDIVMLFYNPSAPQ